MKTLKAHILGIYNNITELEKAEHVSTTAELTVGPLTAVAIWA